MPLQITALYAGLLCIVGLTLAALVGRERGRTGASLGNSGDKRMIEAERRHMNWVEYVPFIILLLAIIELNGGPRWWLHALGSVLLVARIVHPFGIDHEHMMLWQRFVGIIGTFLVAVAAIATVLWQYVTRAL